MAQSTVVDSSTQVDEIVFMAEDVRPSIKKEDEILVKFEPVECVLCANRNNETYDMFNTKTNAGQSLHQFICKFTQVDISDANNCSKSVCKSCFDLINVLQQAELEYIKLKESFEAIISKNPLFEPQTVHPIQLNSVKNELFNAYDDNNGCDDFDNDSEDEPLAVTRKKRHRKVVKVKKSNVVNKRKSRSKTSEDSWECDECDERGKTGGVVAETAHKLAAHSTSEDTTLILRDIIKKEDSPDRSQSPTYNFKIEFDEDSSSSFTPEETKKIENKAPKKTKLISPLNLKPKIRKKRDIQIIHQCDQCDSKFTSIQRLQQHKSRHEDSKPPYICEVCGAHYKHKRACDIHVALHKGISDWKCEECNKLFPSKGALKRHNNIHTGKLNYQCDLCGKSFIHTSSFKMHKLSHSGVKPHSCDVCGLALMTRSHLKRHKRVHSGEKRHECAVCGKRFSERYNLAAHSKSHETSAPPQPAPRRRLFRCHFCTERFERRYMLERHMPAAHGHTLERPPPTPRNTMSKLLKAQAQARSRPEADSKSKPSASPERSPGDAAPKLFAHLTSGAPSAAVTTWSGAYAAEFGLRPDYH